jgi:hypothetical protein
LAAQLAANNYIANHWGMVIVVLHELRKFSAPSLAM